MSPRLVAVFILLLLLLTGCNLTAPIAVSTPSSAVSPSLEFSEPTQIQPPIDPTQPIHETTLTPLATQQVVLDRAIEVIALLKNKDLLSLAKYVHPLMGLRFSPYAYVQDTNLVFTQNEVAGLLANDVIYIWGNFSGSDAPIELSFADYYLQFVYDVDFANAPQIALNHRLGLGNSLDNSQDFYPGSMIVEYYFPGFDPQYEGMDWRSLRLVFMQDNNNWFLTGIIHDEWTP